MTVKEAQLLRAIREIIEIPGEELNDFECLFAIQGLLLHMSLKGMEKIYAIWDIVKNLESIFLVDGEAGERLNRIIEILDYPKAS